MSQNFKIDQPFDQQFLKLTQDLPRAVPAGGLYTGDTDVRQSRVVLQYDVGVPENVEFASPKQGKVMMNHRILGYPIFRKTWQP